MDYLQYLKFLVKIPFQKQKLATGYYQGIYDIPESVFSEKKLIIFDMDDTLGEFLGQLPEKSRELLKRMQMSGIKVAVFSNSKPSRTAELRAVFEKLSVYNVSRSDKPNTAGYTEILEHFDVKSHEAVMIGDKLGTDLFGALQASITSRILVEPYSYVYGGNQAGILDKFFRAMEKLLFKHHYE